jgi:putative IMPACT (imprinted ancient) family translation regulator
MADRPLVGARLTLEGAAHSLDELPLETRRPSTRLRLEFDFEFESLVRRVLADFGSRIEVCEYGERVCLRVEASVDAFGVLVAALEDGSSGRISVIQEGKARIS